MTLPALHDYEDGEYSRCRRCGLPESNRTHSTGNRQRAELEQEARTLSDQIVALTAKLGTLNWRLLRLTIEKDWPTARYLIFDITTSYDKGDTWPTVGTIELHDELGSLVAGADDDVDVNGLLYQIFVDDLEWPADDYVSHVLDLHTPTPPDTPGDCPTVLPDTPD